MFGLNDSYFVFVTQLLKYIINFVVVFQKVSRKIIKFTIKNFVEKNT